MSDNDDRETPPELFTQLDAEFRFTLDACATPANAKCARFCTFHDSGLRESWAGESVWCNPPYSDIESWVKKAHKEVDAKCIVMLVPATRTEQAWWQDLVEPFRDNGGRLHTRFLRGRTRFLKDGVRMGSPKFGCVLLVWS